MYGETANLILRTAHKLISERGYSAFSYADIAEAVAIRKPSIHHHFPTKAGLVKEVLKQYTAQLVDTTERLERELSDPLDRLKWLVERWETCIVAQEESFCVAALLAAELPVLPQEVGAEVQNYFDRLTEWVESTFSQGKITGSMSFQGTARAEAESFIAVIHGAMLSARAYSDCRVYRDVTQRTLERLSAR